MFPKVIFFVQEHFGKIKLNNNVTGFVKRGLLWSVSIQPISKQLSIVRVITLIPIITKFLAMSFKTTLGFILTCCSWWQFGFSSMPRQILCPAKLFNSFIKDCIIDLGITNWFEIVHNSLFKFVEVNWMFWKLSFMFFTGAY